jgi:CBS domain-containing protein
MLASGAIEKTPTIVLPSQTVSDAIEALRAKSQVRAAVVDGDGRIVGLLGLHDILRQLLPSYVLLDPNLAHSLGEDYYASHFAKLAKARVSDVMVRDFASIPPDSSLGRAIAVMNDQQWQPLPVADRGRFIGMLTRSSILDALAVAAAQRAPTPPLPGK